MKNTRALSTRRVLGLLSAIALATQANTSPTFNTDTTLRTHFKTHEQASKPTPLWIWSTEKADSNQVAVFKRSIEVTSPIRHAVMWFSCDNEAVVRIGDSEVAQSGNWQVPVEVDLTSFLKEGENEVIVHARNQGGPAAFVAVIELELVNGQKQRIVTNKDWMIVEEGTLADIMPAVELGPFGIQPWGQLVGILGNEIERNITVAPGFEVELVYSVPRSQGSWVSMTVDKKGRLITSDQSNGLFRLIPSVIGENAEQTRVEAIDSPVGAAQGLLCIDDDLYCVVAGNRAQGQGLYRLRDTDGDDQYDEWEHLRKFAGAGEHGPHGIVEGPDGMLYIVGGNHTKLPDPEESRVPRVWNEDHLLPRLWDANGHAVGIMAPGGWICRTDRNGETWELFSNGYRNPYDIAFNKEGELFTYDADMEWDMGAPWYRPTRVNHVVSGSEFGWRSGTAKWPTHYPDSLPAILDIGPGSPTGITFGYQTNFPQRYQDALFILDWTFGTIYAVHIEPKGASYQATREVFLTGRPLPVADAVVNPVDGALYFVVGGRNVPSVVYRVVYTGTDLKTENRPIDSRVTGLRSLRRELETFHTPSAPTTAIDLIWRHLGHDDRFIRYAARVALEHQPVERWYGRPTDGMNTFARLGAMIALARCGDANHQQQIIKTLSSMRWEELDQVQRLDWLRAWSLCFIRLGKPVPSYAARLTRTLETIYPSGNDLADRELCDLLVYLDSQTVVSQTIPLMERGDATEVPAIDAELLSRSASYGGAILQMADALPQRQQIHYALSLRNATEGWTQQLRERYFRWFETALRTRGGNSFSGFLKNIRKDALANTPEKERAGLQQIGTVNDPLLANLPIPEGPGRAWTVNEVEELVNSGLSNRNFDNGKRMYAAATCIRCHRFAGMGEMGGADLTAVATRFTIRDLAESIIEPSRTISDQLMQSEFVLTNGKIILGRVVGESEGALTILSSYLAPDATYDLPRSMIAEQRPSTVSMMMPNLIDPLSRDEVLDLFAFLLSEGDPDSPLFAQPDDEGFTSLFDGMSLDGWEGDPTFWSVQDGAIVGHTTVDSPASQNTFLIWQGAPVTDFELRAEVQVIGDNNSGIQYRAVELDGFRLHGYQCDIHPRPDYNAMLYEEGGRGIVATNGQRLHIHTDGKREQQGTLEKPVSVPLAQWNEYTIIAKGRRLEHRLNGVVTIVVNDDEVDKNSLTGLIGFQIHVGQPYEVRFRNIRLRRID